MSEDQKYVKVSFEYGTDDGKGTFTPKNTGESVWVSLTQDAAVLLESHAVIPGFVLMLEKAGELGMETSGSSIPNSPDNVPGKSTR